MAHCKLHAAWFHEPHAFTPSIPVYFGPKQPTTKPNLTDLQQTLTLGILWVAIGPWPAALTVGPSGVVLALVTDAHSLAACTVVVAVATLVAPGVGPAQLTHTLIVWLSWAVPVYAGVETPEGTAETKLIIAGGRGWRGEGGGGRRGALRCKIKPR